VWEIREDREGDFSVPVRVVPGVRCDQRRIDSFVSICEDEIVTLSVIDYELQKSSLVSLLSV
jgi:hypothetical protein